jgi:hypothetical protein
MKARWIIALAAALMAAVVIADEKPAAPSPASMKEMCQKHCDEMAAAHAKMMADQKAMTEKRDAAWKEIRATIASAKTLHGDKKLAALESALDKLAAFHEEMMKSMPAHGGHAPMCGEMMGHSMDHRMGMGMGMMMDDCCGGMAKPEK